MEHTYAGSQNSSGDDQLQLEIDCDNCLFDAVRESGVYATAASEETPVETNVMPTTTASSANNATAAEDDDKWYSVGFDPLDGSSIIDANFSVGSIFGIWEGTQLLGRTGREQCASAVSLYGPRTTLLIALPSSSRDEGLGDVTFEVVLVHDKSHWEVSRSGVRLEPRKKVFAPGNLRATNDNDRYDALV